MAETQEYQRVGAEPRAAILSRIARDYNVAIYEVGAQVSLNALDDEGDLVEVMPGDVGYHP